jgi:CheY-like chemotaxis protein
MSLPDADRDDRDSTRPLRILVVDDDLNVARAMCRRLRGHDVHVASSGVDAVALCLHADFDLILCDVMMPNLSGPGVHQRLSALRPDLVPRIVFVTGGIFTAEVTSFLEQVETRAARE